MNKQINILLASLILVLGFSCKKDPNDIPIGTIKVKINGITKTFSDRARATRIPVSGGYGVQVQGYFKPVSTTNLTFTVVRPGAISAGTYTENAGGNPLVRMTNCTEVLIPCFFQTNSYGSPANPVSITITEITSSSVKGTFSGELRAAGTTDSEVFTNGIFHVSF